MLEITQSVLLQIFNTSAVYDVYLGGVGTVEEERSPVDGTTVVERVINFWPVANVDRISNLFTSSTQPLSSFCYFCFDGCLPTVEELDTFFEGFLPRYVIQVRQPFEEVVVPVSDRSEDVANADSDSELVNQVERRKVKMNEAMMNEAMMDEAMMDEAMMNAEMQHRRTGSGVIDEPGIKKEKVPVPYEQCIMSVVCLIGNGRSNDTLYQPVEYTVDMDKYAAKVYDNLRNRGVLSDLNTTPCSFPEHRAFYGVVPSRATDATDDAQMETDKHPLTEVLLEAIITYEEFAAKSTKFIQFVNHLNLQGRGAEIHLKYQELLRRKFADGRKYSQ